jgi:hypothetical protein
MLLAGLDGVQNRIDPGDPLEKDIYDLSPEELKDVPTLPGSLDDSLKALEADHDFLLKGRRVQSRNSSSAGFSYKRDREITRCACARIRWSCRCITKLNGQVNTMNLIWKSRVIRGFTMPKERRESRISPPRFCRSERARLFSIAREEQPRAHQIS